MGERSERWGGIVCWLTDAALSQRAHYAYKVKVLSPAMEKESGTQMKTTRLWKTRN